MTDTKLQQDFRAARRVSIPILGIATPDPAATRDSLIATLAAEAPICEWDIVRGLRGTNKAGTSALAALAIAANATMNPVEALSAAMRLPKSSVVFMFGAAAKLKEPGYIQAIWNLRDEFKLDRRTLVLMDAALAFPPQLSGDVITLDEPLPTRAELEATLDQCHRNAEVPVPTGEPRAQALDAIVGLPTFTADQVLSLGLTRNGLDLPKLWERKRQAIEATDGLKVWRGGETFADLRGIDNAVDFMQQLVTAKAFGTVVFIDEGDKALAGGMADHVGDTGVSKDQVGCVLTYIEDTRSLGVLLAGLPGTGKSALAKSVANAAGKVCIVLDLGGMKTKSLGGSEAAIRSALKVITATAEGRVLFIMTANNTSTFTPELNRRFPDQFFFDLPDSGGRADLWKLYGAKFGLSAAQLDMKNVDDAGWTGAEIKRACDRAAMFKVPVSKATQFIVPTCKSAKAQIERARETAAGRFLSAQYPGLYEPPAAAAPSRQRKIDVS